MTIARMQYCTTWPIPFLRLLRPPELLLPSAVEAVDASFEHPPSLDAAAAQWAELLVQLKLRRAAARAAHAKDAALGLPPSWSRRQEDGRDVAAAAVLRLQESGVDVGRMRTWRRKFVWFPADSQRPPYYGSMRKRWVRGGGGRARELRC
jgi:hypothetical protein